MKNESTRPHQHIINNILLSLQSKLDDKQLRDLKEALYINLNNYEVQPRTTAVALTDDSVDATLKKFLATKKLEGCATSTLKRYAGCLYPMLHEIGKSPDDIETFDLRFYLANYQLMRHVSNRTFDGMRRCIKSFFSFCQAEQLIERNPSLALAQIKYDKTIKRACPTLRDRALVELLYPTGYRRTLATNMLNSGASIQDVAQILGHEDLETTQVYCNVSIVNVQIAHQKYIN